MNEHKQPEEIMRQLLELEKELKRIKSRTERPIPVDKDRNGKLSVDYTLKDWLNKLNEEVDELKNELLGVYNLDEIPGHSSQPTSEQKRLVADEMCDVIKMLYSIAKQIGIDGDYLDTAMHRCNEKTRQRGCHEL